mmetsp:Transcript_59963/g.107926  ORF Transcript_59963/g.107926 Transcript_59963/m.107926 type:complete len:130 (-) Transcript_59963:110-499(-)
MVTLALPADCWRVVRLEVRGNWKDQGWGNTGCNHVTIMAESQHAGRIQARVHTINHKDEGYKASPTNTAVEYSLETGCKNKDNEQRIGRSLLEILTGGDELKLTIACVPWRGHTAHGSNSSLVVEYLQK